MIGALRVLAVVPARGGSKRVPRKNLRLVGGKPLLTWTVNTARRANHIDHIAISSDDDEILELARSVGCDTPLRRPAALATDETPGVDPVLHALDALPGYDLVVLLQPTSPLRRALDIDSCIAKCASPGVEACVSLTAGDGKPEWMYRVDARGCMIPAFSQDAAGEGQLYILNGAVYSARVPWLRQHRTFLTPETLGYVMPEEFSLDIDTPQDLALAETLLQKSHAAS